MSEPKRDTRKKGVRTLTAKQDAFVTAYLETGSFTEAYRRAYKPTTKRRATINQNAYQMSEIPHVKAQIAERLAQRRLRAEQKAAVTIETITDMLRDAASEAKTNKQIGAYVQAAQVLGKLHGLIVDKVESRNVNKNITELTDEQLEAIARKSQEDLKNQAVIADDKMAQTEPKEADNRLN